MNEIQCCWKQAGNRRCMKVNAFKMTNGVKMRRKQKTEKRTKLNIR